MPAPTPFPGSILITGGRGRLATIIANRDDRKARQIRRYSRNPDDKLAPLQKLFEPAELTGATTLLHLAWSTLPATSEQAAGIEWKTDLPCLEHLLQSTAQVPVAQRPHFIFFSSGGAVYGNAPGRPNREDDPCQPIGWYGRGKRAAEEVIERWSAQHQLATTILRISNPYGYPVPAERAQGIIPHAVRCAREGLPLTLWGDGNARKDFIHYTDFLTALDLVIDRQITGTFNLGFGESHSVLEIIALVEKYTEKKIRLQHTPGPAWDVTDSRITRDRLTQATGWRPLIGLDEGIRRAVAGT